MIVLRVVLFVLVVLSFNPVPASSGEQNGKCPDGTCDAVEKRTGRCPEDCKAEGASGGRSDDSCDFNHDGQVDSVEQNKCGSELSRSGREASGLPSASVMGSPSGLGGGEVLRKSQSLESFDFHYLATGRRFGDILKLFNPVIDQANRKLYVVGSKTSYIAVIDLDRDELIETFDLEANGGFLILNNNSLYSFDFEGRHCFQVMPQEKKAQPIAFSTCEALAPPRDKDAVWGKYTFRETGYRQFAGGKSGFPVDWRQDLNGAYGVIEIYDSSSKKVGEIIQGADSLYFAIDQTTGRLYSANSGDGSVSVYDLNNLEGTGYCRDNSCWVKDIDVGNSADELKVDSSGDIYVRNRLGGSVIYKYNPVARSFLEIANENRSPGGIGIWPTDIELSQDEKRLYVLSHYGALIDVVDTGSGKVLSKIRFATGLKPRTDSISAMALDKSRDRLYVAWPELGLIGVADGLNNKPLGTIDLTRYGFDKSKADNAGPGQINLAVNEKTNKLYVHLFNGQSLLVFDAGTLTKEKDIPLSNSRKMEISLVCNAEKGLLYFTNKIIDCASLKEIGSFSSGKQVAAFDNKEGAVYLTEVIPSSRGKNREKVYKFVNNDLVKEWTLEEIGSIPSRFHFDFENNVFYAAYFTTAVVEKFDLLAGDAPGVYSSLNKGSLDSSSRSASCDFNNDGRVDSVEQGKCGKI